VIVHGMNRKELGEDTMNILEKGKLPTEEHCFPSLEWAAPFLAGFSTLELRPRRDVACLDLPGND
jgi:hypothetical protein